ncbi:MAG: hypothetical protein J6Z82_02500 [Schwartzia sp.]|nr:hypothetical protein [Schwartzia sp. (in: firmicutes)]
MMISPYSFIEEYKDKSYAELLLVRDSLLNDILTFEKQEYEPELRYRCPSPDVVYQCNLQYLGKLCELIQKKYNHEFIWGKNNDTST